MLRLQCWSHNNENISVMIHNKLSSVAASRYLSLTHRVEQAKQRLSQFF